MVEHNNTNEIEMKQAFGYIRVSSKGQIDRDGFKRQEKAIHDYAKRHRYEIIEIFREEGVSGTKAIDERPAFQEMVSAILKNTVNIVIVERLDRLAREYRVQEQILIYLASKDIELISAETDENITQAVKSDPMRLATVQMQGIFAQLEKSLLVKKLRKSRERLRAAGKKVEGRKSYSEIAPEILAEIKRLRKKPKGKKRMGYDKVAEVLNKKGYTTATGKKFTRNIITVIVHRHLK